jgi:hypothetical protein
MARIMSDRPEWTATNGLKKRLAMIGFRKGSGGVGRMMAILIDALRDQRVETDLLLPLAEHSDVSILQGQDNRYVMDLDHSALAESTIRKYLSQRHTATTLSNRGQSHRLYQRSKVGAERPCTARRINTNALELLKRSNRWTYTWKRWRLAPSIS